MECPICTECLGSKPPTAPSETEIAIPQFVGGTTRASAESSTVYRLKCGHAFHSNCLLPHVTSQSYECPMCRVEPEGLRIGSNLVFEVSLDDLMEAASPNHFGSMMQSVEAFQFIRQNNRAVQRARHKLNLVRREYIDLETKLCQERARRLNQIVDRFASDYHEAYESMCKKLKRALGEVRRVEKLALEDEQGAQANQIMQNARADETEQSLRTVTRRHLVPILDPSRRSFWRRH